jgi:hypothetical protein
VDNDQTKKHGRRALNPTSKSIGRPCLRVRPQAHRTTLPLSPGQDSREIALPRGTPRQCREIALPRRHQRPAPEDNAVSSLCLAGAQAQNKSPRDRFASPVPTPPDRFASRCPQLCLSRSLCLEGHTKHSLLSYLPFSLCAALHQGGHRYNLLFSVSKHHHSSVTIRGSSCRGESQTQKFFTLSNALLQEPKQPFRVGINHISNTLHTYHLRCISAPRVGVNLSAITS